MTWTMITDSPRNGALYGIFTGSLCVTLYLCLRFFKLFLRLIYDYFMEGHDSKEAADFLKHEYGTGGCSHALAT